MKNYRRFNIVIMDNFYRIKDRFNLDNVIAPSGLGFKFNIYTVKSNGMEFLTNIILENISVKLNIIFLDPNAYNKYNSFKAFIMKYSALGNKMMLEYYDTTNTVYCDIRIEQCDKGEKVNGYLTVPTTIKRLSPYFEWIDNQIIIQYSLEGKTYPYTYPYTYGSGLILNNEIKNTFILPSPLIVVISGVTPAPYITLSNDIEDNYQIIKFKTGADLSEGDRLIIDSISSQILFYPSDSEEPQDWFDNVDLDASTSQEESRLVTHFWAKPNAISYIGITTLQSDQSGRLEAKYRRQVA